MMPSLNHTLQDIRITSDALKEHNGTVSIDSGTLFHLRIADDIDALFQEEQKLEGLAENLNNNLRTV